jgi:hypothetical protein
MNIPVFAATEEIVSGNNKFGGITKKIKYSEEEDYNHKGIRKTILYYDDRGHERIKEIYATDSYANKVGSYKTVIYYENKGKVVEIFSTDIETADKGFFKLVLHIGPNNKLKKREYYFAEKSAIAVLGIYKRVIYYDLSGKIIKVKHLDSVGNITMAK